VGTTHPHASLVDRVGDRVDIRVVADRERFEVVVARCLHLVDQLRRREARLGKGIELSGCRNRLRRGSGIGLIRTGLYAPHPGGTESERTDPRSTFRRPVESVSFARRSPSVVRLSCDIPFTSCRTICPAVPDGASCHVPVLIYKSLYLYHYIYVKSLILDDTPICKGASEPHISTA